MEALKLAGLLILGLWCCAKLLSGRRGRSYWRGRVRSAAARKIWREVSK
jgi:hypothetical protein